MPHPRTKEEKATIRELANTMRHYGEGFTQTDALQHFSQEEISRHWQAACDLANERPGTAA